MQGFFGSKYHSGKVHIIWEGHKILRNLHRRFVLCSNGQICDEDFAKFCGLLRIYELYIDISRNMILFWIIFQVYISIYVSQLSIQIFFFQILDYFVELGSKCVSDINCTFTNLFVFVGKVVMPSSDSKKSKWNCIDQLCIKMQVK